MFNALSATKFVISGVVGIGAGKIVRSIIANNISAETLIDKITSVAGAWAIGGMVATASKNYTDEAIDDFYNAVSKIVYGMKDQAKLNRINRGESTFEKEGLDQLLYVKEADGKWHPKKIVDGQSVSDSTFERIKKAAKEAGLKVTVEKVDGEWTIVDAS